MTSIPRMTTRSETDALSRLPQHVVDVAVVGAGVTGLTTALLLARRGLDVCVVSDDAALSDDAAPSDDVAPGGRPDAPAAISRLQGSRLARVRGRTTASTTRAFAESQDAAVRWLEDFVPSRDVPHRRRPAITYAIGERALAELDAEERLGRLLGRPVEETTDVGLPFQPRRALRLPDQLHVDPRDLLAALRRAARDAGVTLIAPVRVRGARASNPVVVDTDAGDLRADRLILATGTPILDRGLYFAKLAPRRTLFLSSRVADSELPEATAWGIDAPVQQLGAGLGGSDGLLVTAGGEHGVGRSASERHAMDALVAGTRRWWPGAEIEREWSAQGYEAPHLVPFVGWLPRSRGRIFLAAGLGGAGLTGGSLTGGVAAALTLEADLLGPSTDWQKTLHRRLTLPPAVAAGIGENAAAATWYARGWWRALTRELPVAPAEGVGEVGHVGLIPVGVSTVGGATRSVRAVCPHLGAVVSWNDLEHTWDCPAHGSRFAPDGRRLEGPSVRDLAPAPRARARR